MDTDEDMNNLQSERVVSKREGRPTSSYKKKYSK